MKPSFIHSIRGRLAGGVALIALVLAGGGAAVGYSITQVMESTSAMNAARDGRIAVAKAVDAINSMHLNSAEAIGHLMAGVVAGAQASGEFGDEALAKAAKKELSDAEDHLANAETASLQLTKTDWPALVPQRDMSKDMSDISTSLTVLRQQMDSIAERVRKGDVYTIGQSAVPVIQLAAKLQDDTARLAKMLSVVQQQHTRTAGEAVETVVRDVNTIALSLMASIGAVLVALVGIYVMTSRQVVVPVERLAATVHRLARAESVTIPSITDKSEIGMLARSLEQVRDAGMSSARVQTALDNASQPVMLADASHVIIYANQASIDLLRELEPTLKNTIPGFSADSVVGMSMDGFHGANAEAIRRKVTAMTSAVQHRGQMAGIIIDIKATPIVNISGERLGTVVEWNDVTSQVHAEEEIARVVDAAASGDFSHSVKEDDKKGYIRNVATSLNTLMMTVTSGLDEIRRGMDALRDGDLTQSISGEGDFGRIAAAYNETTASLSHALTRINEMAGNVRTAASEISQGSEDLAKRTESQASSLEQTSATMEELSGTVKNNAANSQQANAKAALAKDAAEKGGIIADRALKAMASIEEASKKIADIINLMEDISFQTNLLALNAAVEAARAGEAGKGFAVVASEVRSLAQRAERAAADVKHHIGESGDRVKEGVALVTQASGALQDIEKMVHETASLIAGIATASREQAIGIEQVTEAVGKMDEAVQQNAALVEQSTAAASSLSIQANDLFETAGSFRLAGSPTTPDGKVITRVPTEIASAPVYASIPPVSGNTALADDWDQF